MRRSSSILKKHRAAEKVYIPSDARDNQYILAEFRLTDELIEKTVGEVDTNAEVPYQKFYQMLSHQIFGIVEKHGLKNVKFVANNKLVRVRYSPEDQVLHTEKQSFFFYCPEHNNTFNSYFNGDLRARKIKVLFLATGKEVRLNSGKFHRDVHEALQNISEALALPQKAIKMRDHQHLTFDAFAQEKGHKNSITVGFRDISDRYTTQGYPIDGDFNTVTFAIMSAPMARRLLKHVDINYGEERPYTELYEKIQEAFIDASKEAELDQLALIANGLSPFVQYDEDEKVTIDGELIRIGFNPANENGRFCTHWNDGILIDELRMVYFADINDENNNNFGKFVNQVISAANNFGDNVNWKRHSDDLMVRVHQHLTRRV